MCHYSRVSEDQLRVLAVAVAAVGVHSGAGVLRAAGVLSRRTASIAAPGRDAVHRHARAGGQPVSGLEHTCAHRRRHERRSHTRGSSDRVSRPRAPEAGRRLGRTRSRRGANQAPDKRRRRLKRPRGGVSRVRHDPQLRFAARSLVYARIRSSQARSSRESHSANMSHSLTAHVRRRARRRLAKASCCRGVRWSGGSVASAAG